MGNWVEMDIVMTQMADALAQVCSMLAVFRDYFACRGASRGRGKVYR